MNDTTPTTGNARARYFTLVAAFLGWLFDGFEMGLFPLIGQPALKDLLGAQGAEPAGGTPDEFGALIRRDLAKWEKVVKASGARVD